MTWSFVWSGSQQIRRFYFSRDFSFWCESEGNQIKERVSYYVSIKWSYPYLWYNREKPAETQLLNFWGNEVEKFILCKYWGIDSGVRKNEQKKEIGGQTHYTLAKHFFSNLSKSWQLHMYSPMVRSESNQLRIKDLIKSNKHLRCPSLIWLANHENKALDVVRYILA